MVVRKHLTSLNLKDFLIIMELMIIALKLIESRLVSIHKKGIPENVDCYHILTVSVQQNKPIKGTKFNVPPSL